MKAESTEELAEKGPKQDPGGGSDRFCYPKYIRSIVGPPAESVRGQILSFGIRSRESITAEWFHQDRGDPAESGAVGTTGPARSRVPE